MIRKKGVFLVAALGLMTSQAALADDNKILLEAFHKYGIKKCDNFIIENSGLIGNWNYNINKHSDGMDGVATEVTLTTFWGSKGDTIKTDATYIQTAKNCYLRETWTLTKPGACEENVDGDFWYVTNKMPDKDYATYKNKGGVELHAKDITVGNFNACLEEGSKRLSAPHG